MKNPNVEPKYVKPLKKICMTIGQLPSSYLETMSYYEMLVWFVEFLKNQVIPALDNNAEAVSELQQLYIELKDYVDNYFDNLDVQEEVNNKLEEMLENGELEQIIEQFLQSSAIWCFDNVNEMKESTNLINGSYAKTLGYYEINDGGTSLYKIREITEDDEVNEMNIISLNNENLVAEIIINDTLYIKQFGAKGDGETDDSNIINKALSFRGNDYLKIIFNANYTYLCHDYMNLYSNTDIDFTSATIKDNYTGEYDGHHAGLTFRSAVDNANTTGYGATKNIKITGGTFDGYVNGVMFALLHVENISFKNIYFKDCFIGRHIMDLLGCKNIEIVNCTFDGNSFVDTTVIEREMIQPDYARSVSGNYWGTITGYDNLPTENLIISECVFKKGDGNYYPNSIGTHGTGALPHKNIIIKNCEFYDCTKACIRLPKVENLLIENNNFYNINTETIASEHFAIDLTRISEDTITTLSNNIKIINNKFIANNDSGTLNSIMVYGDSSFFIKNVIIKNNIFTSTWISSESTIINKDAIRIGYINNILIDNNIFNENKIAIYKPITAQIDNIKVTNNVMNNCRDFIYGGGSYAEEQGKVNNLNEENNIWNYENNSINLNSFVAVVSLTNNGTLDNKRIIWENSDNPFIEISENGYMVKINRNIHRYRIKAGLMLLANGGTATRELNGYIYDGDTTKYIQLNRKNIINNDTDNIVIPSSEYIRTNMSLNADYVVIGTDNIQTGDYILPKLHTNYLGTYLIIEGF